VCQGHTGQLTGFWFLLKPAYGLNTNEWMNSPKSEFYVPTFRDTLFHLHRQVPTCLRRWNRQSVPKRWHIKFRRRGITQKKTYNIQNTAKVCNQEDLIYTSVDDCISHTGTDYMFWPRIFKPSTSQSFMQKTLHIRKFCSSSTKIFCTNNWPVDGLTSQPNNINAA